MLAFAGAGTIGDGGEIVMRSGQSAAASGGVSIQSLASHSSAKVNIFSGDAGADPSGTLSLSTGSTTDGVSGSVLMSPGAGP